MENTKETTHPENSYQEIATSFSQAAASLIPEDSIQRTLEMEKKRFENASALQISPGKFLGQNTPRHCKELLRRNQPFFPLYLLISFLMESSMALLIYGIIYSNYQRYFLIGKYNPYPVFYALIAIGGFLLYRYISRGIWSRQLARETDKPHKLLQTVKRKQALAGMIICALCVATGAGGFLSGISHHCQMSLMDALILYAGCAILAGTHNLVFDSHILSLLSVGWNAYRPRRKIQPAETARRYINSNLEQLMNQKTSETQAGKILRSRLVSFRIYAVLALIILIPLDILCLYQLPRIFSAPLLIFFLMGLLGSLLCLVVISSCRIVLKILKRDSGEV